MTFLLEDFAAHHTAIEADALVCRHTLEHVNDIRPFLQLVRDWAAVKPGRVVLFELPGAEYVMSECAFWDVYYEHCNYFTRPVLIHAFESIGFKVDRCEAVYGGQYLLLEAQLVSPGDFHTLAVDVDAQLAAWLEFGREAKRAIEACRQSLEDLARDDRPLMIWQGAAKTVGVLTAVGQLRGLRGAVDLNPARHGRYLPGSGLRVVSPEDLMAIDPDHVVLMNAVYRDEVQQQLTSLGSTAGLSTINDLCNNRSIEP